MIHRQPVTKKQAFCAAGHSPARAEMSAPQSASPPREVADPWTVITPRNRRRRFGSDGPPDVKGEYDDPHAPTPNTDRLSASKPRTSMYPASQRPDRPPLQFLRSKKYDRNSIVEYAQADTRSDDEHEEHKHGMASAPRSDDKRPDESHEQPKAPLSAAPVCVYTEGLEQLLEAMETTAKAKREEVEDLFDGVAQVRRTTSGMERFEQVLGMHAMICQKVNLKWEVAQARFFRSYAFACAPLIFGDSWETEYLDFYRKYGINRVRQQVLDITPRRFGKTWIIAMFALSLIWVVPNLKICIFSTNQRTSKHIVGYMKQWLHYLPGGTDRSASDSAEQVRVIPADAVAHCPTMREKRGHPLLSTVTALPSTTTGKTVRWKWKLCCAMQRPERALGCAIKRDDCTSECSSTWLCQATTPTKKTANHCFLRPSKRSCV